jgi:hypothetical protein
MDNRLSCGFGDLVLVIWFWKDGITVCLRESVNVCEREGEREVRKQCVHISVPLQNVIAD